MLSRPKAFDTHMTVSLLTRRILKKCSVKFSVFVHLFYPGLLGFFLNSIAALSFIFVRDQRTPSNFIIFNLNIADLMLNVNGLLAAYASYVR